MSDTNNKDINYSSGALAFIGDCVQTLYVRQTIVSKDIKVKDMHAYANRYVCAEGQDKAVNKIKDVLTEQELEIFKRARNYKTHSMPKHASVMQYKNATGLEALLGYLYLTGNEDRLKQIIKLCMEAVDED